MPQKKSGLIFMQIPVGQMQNFVYIVADSKSKEAAVIDCGWDTELILEAAKSKKLKIKKIILTHYHFDHVQKINDLALKTGAVVLFHELDASEIQKVFGSNKIRQRNLKDNDNVGIGRTKMKILHTPGHTPGSICVLVNGRLFTGDTLFVGAIGRTDLPGGDKFRLFESLQKIKALDDGIEIYPGHDYGNSPFSTIGEEKKYNPYLMCRTKEQFLMIVGF